MSSRHTDWGNASGSSGATRAVSATDPLATVWNALDAHGYEPHGQPHDFRARCPGHNGDNRSALHVRVGADGRCVMHCHAHRCSVEDIARAIGLERGDLFPAGHDRARPRQLPKTRRVDFTGTTRTIANVLKALDGVGTERYIQIRTDCPHCGSPGALLQATRERVTFSCPGDDHAMELGYTACTLEQFTQALAGHVEDRRAA